MPTLLYTTVTERTLAHIASAWIRNLTQRLEKKLSSIQRPVEYYGNLPEDVYSRTTSDCRTHALCDYEDNVHGWRNHSTECIKEGRINSEEDLENKGLINNFIDGSKSDLRVDTTYCILDEQQALHHSWQVRLQEENLVYQAELVAIYESVKNNVTLQSDIKIWSDIQSSLKTIANENNANKIAREIQTLLLNNTNIRLGWICSVFSRVI
ncbi:hypothetical protein AVEN_243636-1 [Araneus ventricosus]|uniref:RNase H type-1 domain-containing protein n=1 Tax=Araneus ventricosus TaxID=182803 RepID=A0A4Y2A5X3_ARAVE|nr:hypothetical protein AVEN_243636-1 [Araneus ventricosus]